jgi:hypothetical protein
MDCSRISDRLNKAILGTVTKDGVVVDGVVIEAINTIGLMPLPGSRVFLEWHRADEKYPAGYRIVGFA